MIIRLDTFILLSQQVGKIFPILIRSNSEQWKTIRKKYIIKHSRSPLRFKLKPEVEEYIKGILKQLHNADILMKKQ